MSQTFLLSWPPSANSIWRAYRGRNILAARYRAWRDSAGKQLLAQRAKPIPGPVSILIKLCCPTKRAFDLDNRIKPLLDLLVINGVIESDNADIVQSLYVTTGETVGAEVTLSSLVPA